MIFCIPSISSMMQILFIFVYADRDICGHYLQACLCNCARIDELSLNITYMRYDGILLMNNNFAQ